MFSTEYTSKQENNLPSPQRNKMLPSQLTPPDNLQALSIVVLMVVVFVFSYIVISNLETKKKDEILPRMQSPYKNPREETL